MRNKGHEKHEKDGGGKECGRNRNLSRELSVGYNFTETTVGI